MQWYAYYEHRLTLFRVACRYVEKVRYFTLCLYILKYFCNTLLCSVACLSTSYKIFDKLFQNSTGWLMTAMARFMLIDYIQCIPMLVCKSAIFSCLPEYVSSRRQNILHFVSSTTLYKRKKQSIFQFSLLYANLNWHYTDVVIIAVYCCNIFPHRITTQ